ncbi:MAG: DNA polymerase IV [Candidatus Anammoximicrobium sp.]|nr:DNA polymerase IV [Candidatus Anammoximicrobium sp.]
MILHVDMDAFYASVEERDRPGLAGQPVIVGGTPEGRGVVAAANYLARKFGVHSAMPAVTAHRLCPHGVFLRPRMEYYAEVSDQIRAIFEEYTPLVEPLSLDEAFLDVTGSEPLFGPAVTIGRRIKQQIRQRLRLVASVGVAPNKFLAKIASDLEKPDGFVVVEPTRVQEFLDPLPVGRLWGVGKVTGGELDKLGIRRIGQLRQMPVELLRHYFGSSGDHLGELSRGLDNRPVVPEQEAKSISHETTFARDLEDPEVMQAWLLELSEQVGCRLRRHGLRGRTVHLKVRFGDFHTVTRAQTLPQPTDVTQEIWQTAARMFAQRLPARQLRIRLLGVGLSGFEHPALVQRSLFPEFENERQARLDEVADQIKDKFGQAGLQRALGMLHDVEHRARRPGADRDQYGK